MKKYNLRIEDIFDKVNLTDFTKQGIPLVDAKKLITLMRLRKRISKPNFTRTR